MPKKTPETEQEKPHTLVRSASEHFQVPFTEAEMREKSKELAMKTQEIKSVQSQKSSAAKQFDARIKEIETRIQVLSDQVSTGQEIKIIRCEWHMNVPVRGRKTLYRCDTREIVRDVEMLDSDAQMVIDDLKRSEKTVDEKPITPVRSTREAGDLNEEAPI
jgi:hypothetical protein